MRVTTSCKLTVALLLAPGLAAAAEIGPVRLFTADPAGTLQVRMKAATGPATIGGYHVPDNDSLTVCDRAGAHCADPYVGAVFALQPGQHLVMDLQNALRNDAGAPTECMAMDGKAGLLNLHTHGLLVPPYARPGAAPPTFGDTVFHCVLNGPGGGGGVVANTMRYDIGLADIAPGVHHPLGIDWVHPHVHGLAKAQVSSGMTSMITVGDVDDLLCARPSAGGSSPAGGRPAKNCVRIPPDRVKHLMLKDAQLVQLGSQAEGDTDWHNKTDQNPDFCGLHKFDSGNFGECPLDGDALGDATVRDGRWVFTINGQKNPHWDIGPGRYEIWRVQNASANVTYRLGLHALTVGPAAAERAPFQVLDMDGAGLAAVSAFGDARLPTTDEILLMPSSRVDLLVQAPRQNRSNVTYALDNDNFQAGFSAGDADIWPHIRLATVTFRAQPTYLEALAPRPAFSAQALVAAAPSTIDEGKLAAELPKNCQGFGETGLTDEQKQFYADHLHVELPWKRRIYFGVLGDEFALRATLVDGEGVERDLFGRPITDDHPITLQTFSQMEGVTSLCVRKSASPETWQLVNVSNEVHNFHIHQLKFRIVRDGDGAPVMRAPSPIDRVLLPKALLFKHGEAQLLHDVIIVPRGSSAAPDDAHKACTDSLDTDLRLKRRPADNNLCDGTLSATDLSGSIEVSMTFDGSQFVAQDDGTGTRQHAKFVFHCHILEHEDKGMMAGITVIDPTVYR